MVLEVQLPRRLLDGGSGWNEWSAEFRGPNLTLVTSAFNTRASCLRRSRKVAVRQGRAAREPSGEVASNNRSRQASAIVLVSIALQGKGCANKRVPSSTAAKKRDASISQLQLNRLDHRSRRVVRVRVRPAVARRVSSPPSRAFIVRMKVSSMHSGSLCETMGGVEGMQSGTVVSSRLEAESSGRCGLGQPTDLAMIVVPPYTRDCHISLPAARMQRRRQRNDRTHH